MEKLSLEETINQISQAYADLENANGECYDLVESALDAFLGEKPEKPKGRGLLAAYKVEMSRRKTATKNIKKLAKAMMKGEREGVAEETANMDELLQAIGG